MKNGKRYRYYITHSSEVADEVPAWRLPAHDIEAAVINRLVSFLEDRAAIRGVMGSDDAGKLSTALASCQQMAERLRTWTFHRRTKLPVLIDRVEVGDKAIGISLSPSGAFDLMGLSID